MFSLNLFQNPTIILSEIFGSNFYLDHFKFRSDENKYHLGILGRENNISVMFVKVGNKDHLFITRIYKLRNNSPKCIRVLEIN